MGPQGTCPRLQRREPLRRRARGERRGDLRDQLVPVRDPRRIGGVARVRRELRQPGDVAEAGELPVVAHGDDEEPVGGAKDLVRDDRLVRVAHAPGHPSRGEVGRAEVREHRHLRVEERQVDVLALARAFAVEERRDDGVGGIHAGEEVGHGDADLLRTAAGKVVALAGHAHEAAQALDHEVVAGPVAVRAVLAEPGDRAVDEPLVARAQRGVVEAVALARSPTLKFSTTTSHAAASRLRDRLPLGAGDVERDRLLAAVGREEVRGVGRVAPFAVLEERRPPACACRRPAPAARP